MLDKLNFMAPQTGADESKAAITPAAPAVPDPATAKVTKAAIDFESFFISNMLHQMRETQRTIAPEDSPYKDKVNQDMQDMADNVLAGSIANQRAFGIADAILKQMLPSAAAHEPKTST
ncbi:rod-binding protein [Massilia sp. 9096]|uniref:rod-binding protein n=1 Tax=Massilia sp. 9096 TaxID=1500894 RepID=UPI000ACAC2A9|nr:rod-binding protein [Massilia sp. 9096]